MVRRSWLLLAAILALACCSESAPRPPAAASAGTGGAPVAPAPAEPAAPPPASPAAPTMNVTLLAPVTGSNAERGQALVQAAQIALAAPGSPTLSVRDTGSTPQGAAAAAQAAVDAHDGLILGPLTAGETAAVAPVAAAAGIPVLAFTNDSSQARPGVWTLGITPAQQVRRMVGALLADGKTRFAAVLPPGEFGSAMGKALAETLAAAGASAPDIRIHDGSNQHIADTLRDISQYPGRRGGVDARIRALKALHTAAARKEAAALSREPIPPAPFDALLLADVGETLAWEATFLRYYDISAPEVRLLGPALWSSSPMRGGAELNGAWYAAPDPAARATFDQEYQAKFGTPAPALADFAYDAAAIARVLSSLPRGYAADSLCRPDGFAGVDGVLALQPDGRVRRGLALFEIQQGTTAIVSAAPGDLASPGI